MSDLHQRKMCKLSLSVSYVKDQWSRLEISKQFRFQVRFQANVQNWSNFIADIKTYICRFQQLRTFRKQISKHFSTLAFLGSKVAIHLLLQ